MTLACALCFSALRRDDGESIASYSAEDVHPGAEGGYVDVTASSESEAQLMFRLASAYGSVEEDVTQPGRQLKNPQKKIIYCRQSLTDSKSPSVENRLYACIDSVNGELRTHFKIADGV